MRDWLYNIDVEDMLDCMDIDYERSSAHILRFPCPFHDGMHNTFCINDEDSTFFCHKCKVKGTAPELVSHLLRISPMEATRMLKERYQPGFINPDARDTVAEIQKILSRRALPEPEQPLLDESELERFSVDWSAAHLSWSTGDGFPACDYLFERGFDPATLEDWEFGYDARTDRVTFAVRDERGRLVGFKGRVTDDRQPKYLVIGDTPRSGVHYGFPPYYNSRIVYGAHRLKSVPELVICEGEWNAIAVCQKTDHVAVAINGSNFTETQARIIRNLTERVILFLDSDKAGQMATWGWTDDRGHNHPGVVEQLRPFMSVHVVPDHGDDPMGLVRDLLLMNLASAQPWTLAPVS